MSKRESRKRYRAYPTQNRLLHTLQSSLIASLLAHWVFQGVLYMDRTERLLKIVFNVTVTLAFLTVCGFEIGLLIPALLIAHTLNLLVNGHLLGVLKSFDISFANTERLERYLEQFAMRAKRNRSVGFAGVYGSLARGALRGTSDLDIRLVSSHDELWCTIRCAIFATRERTIALMQGIPLDIYAFDSDAALASREMRELPLVLKSGNSA